MKERMISMEGNGNGGNWHASKGTGRKRLPLWMQVLAGVVAGTGLGLLFGKDPFLGSFGNAELGQLGMLVIRLLKTLAVPLVLFAILDALLRTQISARKGGKLILICLANVSVAFVIGLTIMNVFKPGVSLRSRFEAMVREVPAEAEVKPAGAKTGAASLNIIKNLTGYVPSNMVSPFLENNLITIVFAGLLGGCALRRVRARQEAAGERGASAVADAIGVIYACLMQLLVWVIHLVPFAVFGIIADRVGSVGLDAFRALWALMGVILLGLGIHSLCYYPLAVWLLGGIKPGRFFRGGADAVVTAASGNSSLAAVPVTLCCLTQKLGISEESARLSACIGTNLNNDGITLYEAMAALFLAQACGLDLTVTQQAVVVLASLMAGVGVAGVPEAGLVVLPLVLGAAGLPDWVVAAAYPLLLPVDWILARARSGVNVMSDMVVAILLDGRRPSPPAPQERMRDGAVGPGPGERRMGRLGTDEPSPFDHGKTL